MIEKSKIRIAIQKDGRLKEKSVLFLASLGIKCLPNGRKLFSPCPDTGVELLFLRNDDIPEYVARSVADFGIVGQNLLAEKGSRVKVVKTLGFSKCKLVIAVPYDSPIKDIKKLEGERIATSYPRLLKEFLIKNRINAAVIPIKGSVEITTGVNLADAICDITKTGQTLKDHDLQPIATILESEAVLIQSPTCKSSLFDIGSV